jgi:predicted secreted protein
VVLSMRTVLAALFLAGCVSSSAPVAAPPGSRVALAFVVDDPDHREIADAPPPVHRDIGEVFVARGIAVDEAPFDRVQASFRTRRRSEHRLEALAQTSQANIVCLVELMPRFFSQLAGRYRWTVQVRATIAERGALDDAIVEDYELPVFLEYTHENETDALERVAPSLARSLRSLVDDFVGGMGTTSGGERTETARSDAIYFVMVDRFANGDPSNDGRIDASDPNAWHGGDLAGIRARLDEIASLGVGAIWLSPIFRTRAAPFHGHGAFHGYWVTDHREIDPRFGTMEELRALRDELARRGMKLYLDMVLNHVGYDAPFLAEHPDWFHRRGDIEDWSDPDELVFGDVHGLPDLAEERDDVYGYLRDASFSWIDRVEPAGFRLDAVKHMSDEFWARYNGDVRAHAGDGFVLLGEALDGNPATIAALFERSRFSHLFDFPLHFAAIDAFCRDAPTGRLASVLFDDRTYADPSRLVTLADNHDLPRVASACEPTERDLVLSFLLTARGIPSLTYGTEVGLEGEREPENRADMRFEETPIGALIRDRLALRAREASLRSPRTTLLEVGDRTMLYGRGDDVLVALNLGDSAHSFAVPEGGVDLISGAELEREVAVDARSMAFVRVRAESSTSAENMREVSIVVTGPGTDLRVVGSGPELGAWNLDRGVNMQATNGTHRATMRLPTRGAFAFKIVDVSSGDPRWETDPNHYLFVPEGDGPITLPIAPHF